MSVVPAASAPVACRSSRPAGARAWLARSAFARRLAGTFATRLVLVVLSMVLSVIVTRSLGPAGRGEYALTIAMIALAAQLLNLGLHSANTYSAANDPSRTPLLLGNSLALSAVCGSLFAGAYVMYAWLFPRGTPISGAVLALALAAVPLATFYPLAQGLLIGTHRVRAYNGIEITTGLLSLGLVASLWAADRLSVESVLAVGLLSSLVSGTLAICALTRGFREPIGVSRPLLSASIGYGGYVYLIALVSLAMRRADLFAIEHFLGRESAGVYSIAQTLGDTAYLFPQVLGTLIFPRLVESESTRAARTIQASWLAAGSVAAALVVALPLMKPAIQLLYGPAFARAAGPALVLVAAMAFYAVGNILGAYILAHGRSPGLALVWLAAAAANTASLLLVVPNYGMLGAALGLLVTYAAVMGAQLAMAVRIHRRSSFPAQPRAGLA